MYSKKLEEIFSKRALKDALSNYKDAKDYDRVLRAPLIIGNTHNISSFCLGKALICRPSRS